MKNDPSSRQAVITIHDDRDKRSSLDVPRTLNLHFLIRDGLLNLIITMRSNDLLWGTPYDVNAFCYIQRIMSCILRVGIGNYYHCVNSLHYYLDKEDQLKKIVSNNTSLTAEARIDVVPSFYSYDNLQEELKKFWIIEKKMRENNDSCEVNDCFFKADLNTLRNYIKLKKQSKVNTNK